MKDTIKEVQKTMWVQFTVRNSAEEADSNRDSEEEDDAIQLFLDDNQYPLLPPLGNMPLEKAKSAIRQYWTVTYHECSVFSGFLQNLTVKRISREIHCQQVGKGSLDSDHQRS